MKENQRKNGIILSYLSMAIQILMTMIYVPILIGFLGKSQYGLYELIGSLIAYMSVMDFGLSATIIRYYSRYMSLGDEEEASNILAISGIIYTFLAVLAFMIGIAVYFNLDSIFYNSLTFLEIKQAEIIFLIMLVNVLVTIPSNVFKAVIQAEEKFVFLRGLMIVQNLLKPFVIVGVLYYKANAINLAIVQTVFNFSVILIIIYYSLVKLKVKIKLYHWNSELVMEILKFSSFIFLNLLIDQIYWKTDQVILGIVAGTSSVAVYSIASKLNISYVQFSANINSVFLARVSSISAKTEDMTEINEIFNKVGRVQFFVMSLVLTGFILYGKKFIVFWAGDEFSDAYIMSIIVMVPLLIPLIENIGIMVLQAKNKHAFRSKIYFFIAILNIILTIPLANRFGGIGCAIGTSIALVIGNVIIINIYYHKYIGIDIISFVREIVNMSKPVLISISLGILLNYYFKVTTILSLGLHILVYCLIFTSFMWLLGFNNYEKRLFKETAYLIKKSVIK